MNRGSLRGWKNRKICGIYAPSMRSFSSTPRPPDGNTRFFTKPTRLAMADTASLDFLAWERLARVLESLSERLDRPAPENLLTTADLAQYLKIDEERLKTETRQINRSMRCITFYSTDFFFSICSCTGY
jgi:hypothetical protein